MIDQKVAQCFSLSRYAAWISMKIVLGYATTARRDANGILYCGVPCGPALPGFHNGRDDWIASPSANRCATPCRSAISASLRQTSDFYVPNVALYQAELRPDSNQAY